MALARRWAILALALLAAACGRLPDEDPDAPGPAPTAAELYRDRCTSCHQAGASVPYTEVFRQMRPEAVLTALDGVMAQQAAGLSTRQRADLAEFVTGARLGAPPSEPAPLICEPWQNRIDLNRPPNAPAMLAAEGLPRLAVKWAFAIPGATRARAPLSVAGGAVFTGSEDGTVYALDESGGCLRWTFKADAEVRGGIVVSPWQAGDMAAQPALFFGDAAGNAYRLDAATGQLAWKVRTDAHPLAVISGTPVLHDGRLYVAVASTEQIAAADPNYECCSFRGGVVALDAATGRRAWQSWAIRVEPRLTGDTNAAGSPIWQPAGAAVWGGPAIDARRKRLYMATGSAHTSPASIHSDAVIALDLETGKPVWRYQATPRDAWTWSCLSKDKTNCPAENGPANDFVAPPLLVSAPGGKDILLAAQISGDIHGLDPWTGALVWRRKISLRGDIRGAMAADGAMAYVATSGGLVAIDAATGQRLWSSPSASACTPEHRPGCGSGMSAAVTALLGMALAGGIDGRLRAYDALTGQVIWSFDTTAPLPTPGGGTARGGSLDGGAAVAAHGRVFVASGSLLGGHMAGNAVIALEPSRAYYPRSDAEPADVQAPPSVE